MMQLLSSGEGVRALPHAPSSEGAATKGARGLRIATLQGRVALRRASLPTKSRFIPIRNYGERKRG